MTFQKITKDNIENFTLQTNPSRTFQSSSSGISGSVYVYARRSSTEKELQDTPAFAEPEFNTTGLTNLVSAVQAGSRTETNITNKMLQFLSGVNSRSESTRKNKVLNIRRFTPSFTYSINTQKKHNVQKLNQYYRPSFPSYQWATTNYYCLNFFTASSVPSSAVLIYPDDLTVTNTGYESGSYVLPEEFSFDFYIKPRYTTDHPNGVYKAGTILHASSCYAVCLITGSSKSPSGYADGYRLSLQLSHSADVKPSLAIPGNYPKDLVFWSDDNSLKKDSWHHVVIRWGTNTISDGTGSFVIDGKNAGYFVIPSSSVAPRVFSNSHEPSALFVGNYYEGTNNGTNGISFFFAAKPAEREGLIELDDDATQDEPFNYVFNHQLNAELHDVAVKRYYMTDQDILVSSSRAPETLSFHKIAFYLPPFFTKTSPRRKFVGTTGGVLQTPFFSIDGTTDDPFNVAMSFGVGGHYMNLENFVYDFAGQKWPRLLNLSASEYTTTVASASTANTLLYDFPQTALRNLLILPNDDGKFFPNYEMLKTFSSSNGFVDDLNTPELSLISLNNMVSTASIRHAVSEPSGSFMNSIAGSSPEDPGIEPGVTYTILQRTKDPSSNQVTFFDVSNLYYGNRIKPGSLSIIDTGMTGSANKVSIVLKDDGRGNVYRADSSYPATWNSVGNVYYNEGMIAIKSPNLFFFGQDQFEMSFQGEQNIHTMKINILASAKDYNSSSNPSYLPVSASAYDNDPEKRFVYISNINLHDDNFNIIGKTQLAQPVVKRVGDKLMFRIKMDF